MNIMEKKKLNIKTNNDLKVRRLSKKLISYFLQIKYPTAPEIAGMLNKFEYLTLSSLENPNILMIEITKADLLKPGITAKD